MLSGLQLKRKTYDSKQRDRIKTSHQSQYRGIRRNIIYIFGGADFVEKIFTHQAIRRDLEEQLRIFRVLWTS
ncbi:hypothetical protein Hanom_Chr06g00524061 [Helianthus anomalus]